MELAWEDLNGKVAEVAVEVCRVSRKRIGVKRTKWWNEEEQNVVTERNWHIQKDGGSGNG